MHQPLDDALLAKIEAHATDMARGAGAILNSYFGKSLNVQYKDENKRDPVTNADVEAQEFLIQAIADRFPDHSILGEEDQVQDDSPARDFVWVLDPLDGTKNFMAGLPVYASSIGVMHLGVPIAGAVFVPWPRDGGGVVLHARRGGGSFMEQEPITVFPGRRSPGERVDRRARPVWTEFPDSQEHTAQDRRAPGHRQHRLRDGHDGQRRAPVLDHLRSLPMGRGWRRVAGHGGGWDHDAAPARPHIRGARYQHSLGGRGLPGALMAKRRNHHEAATAVVLAAGAGQPRRRALRHLPHAGQAAFRAAPHG